MIPSHQQHSFVYLNEWLWRREAITVAIAALSFPTFDPLAELDYWSGSSATIHKRMGVLSLIWKSLPLQEECRDALSCSFSINNPWKSTMLPRDQILRSNGWAFFPIPCTHNPQSSPLTYPLAMKLFPALAASERSTLSKSTPQRAESNWRCIKDSSLREDGLPSGGSEEQPGAGMHCGQIPLRMCMEWEDCCKLHAGLVGQKNVAREGYSNE